MNLQLGSLVELGTAELVSVLHCAMLRAGQLRLNACGRGVVSLRPDSVDTYRLLTLRGPRTKYLYIH